MRSPKCPKCGGVLEDDWFTEGDPLHAVERKVWFCENCLAIFDKKLRELK